MILNKLKIIGLVTCGLLCTINLNAKDLYLNGKIMNDNKTFSELNKREIHNNVWYDDYFSNLMYKNYNESGNAFKQMITFEEYKVNELDRLKRDYLTLYTTGLSKKESINLYLDIYNTSIITLLEFKDHLDRPVKYDNMITFINQTINNGEVEYEPNEKRFNEIIANYKYYNYAGKIYAIKILGKILDSKTNISELERKLSNIKPDINDKTNLELFIAYYSNFYGKTNKNLPKLDYSDNLLELVIKSFSNNLSYQEYKVLRNKVIKDEIKFDEYLISSNFVDKIIEYNDNFFANENIKN